MKHGTMKRRPIVMKIFRTKEGTMELYPLVSFQRYTRSILYLDLIDALLKINVKLGGLNSLLDVENSQSIPHVSNIPTMFFGMDVEYNMLHQGEFTNPFLQGMFPSDNTHTTQMLLLH